MRPLRLYLKNFMNHSLTEIDCTNFQSVLIVGKSKKNEKISNGVGKTTLFRAIEYSIFNQSHATTLDRVVRDGKKKAVVEFDFELKGETYRIYRHRTNTGSADVRLYKLIGGNFESISGRTPSDTDNIIRDLVKISHKAFTYSVLFRQADLTGITSTSDPKKRKEILKEPLNLATYTKLEEMAVERRKPSKKKIDTLEGSIQIIGTPDKDIEAAQRDLVVAENQIKTNKELIVKADDAVQKKRVVLDSLKESLGQQDIDIHKKVQEQESLLRKLKENAKTNDKRLMSLTNVLSTKENALKVSERSAATTHDRICLLLTEKEKDISDILLSFDKVCKDEMKGTEMLGAVKAQLKLVKKSLPDGDECPTCNQTISPGYRQTITDDTNAKIKKCEDEILFLEDALGKCRRKKTKLEERIKADRVRTAEMDRLEASMISFGKEQKSLRDEIDRLYEDQKDTTKAIQDDERQVEESTKHLASLKEAASKSNALAVNKRIFELNAEITKEQENSAEANRRISSFSSVQGGLLERIRTRTADKEKLVTLNEELGSAKREFKIRQMVVDAFKSIPGFIVQTVLDDLQYEANAALKEIRPELDVQIDAELNFVYRRNGIVRDYEQLSHGQQVYIALAFKRGMAKVIQKRLGTDIRVLEFDEVDAHLDEAGVEAFADAIRKWQKDFTIFVITHNKDLKDKFSHAILVEEGEDGAEARLVTSW